MQCTCKQGGFTVAMPGKPSVKVLPFDDPEGRTNLNVFSVELPDSIYQVGYADMPAELIRKVPAGVDISEFLLQHISASFAHGLGATSNRGHRITLSGNPVRETLMQVAPGVASSRARTR